MQLGFDNHFYKGTYNPKYFAELENSHTPKYDPFSNPYTTP